MCLGNVPNDRREIVNFMIFECVMVYFSNVLGSRRFSAVLPRTSEEYHLQGSLTQGISTPLTKPTWPSRHSAQGPWHFEGPARVCSLIQSCGYSILAQSESKGVVLQIMIPVYCSFLPPLGNKTAFLTEAAWFCTFPGQWVSTGVSYQKSVDPAAPNVLGGAL